MSVQLTRLSLLFGTVLGTLSWRPEQLREIRLLDIFFIKFPLSSHRVAVGLRVNSLEALRHFSQASFMKMWNQTNLSPQCSVCNLEKHFLGIWTHTFQRTGQRFIFKYSQFRSDQLTGARMPRFKSNVLEVTVKILRLLEVKENLILLTFNEHSQLHSFSCFVLFFAAGAGKRHDASEETTGWARSHEAALPSNRGEGGGPTGQTGAGQHQERAQQVMVMIKFNRLGVSFCYVAALIPTSATAKWSQKSARPTQSFPI